MTIVILFGVFVILFLFAYEKEEDHNSHVDNFNSKKEDNQYEYDYSTIGTQEDDQYIDYSGLSYEDLLKTNEWKEKRNEIIQKHNCECDWCKTPYKLEVHHKYYLRYPNNARVYPWEYKDDAFMCLCHNCHIKYHRKYKVKTYYRTYNR